MISRYAMLVIMIFTIYNLSGCSDKNSKNEGATKPQILCGEINNDDPIHIKLEDKDETWALNGPGWAAEGMDYVYSILDHKDDTFACIVGEFDPATHRITKIS